MKINIISGSVFPQNSPRAFRTTELAKGLAKLGHNVTIYTSIGEYDYTEFEKRYNLKVRSIGKSYWGNGLSRGKIISAFNLLMFKLRIPRLLIDYPKIEYAIIAYRLMNKIEPCDLLITIARPYGIHFGVAEYNKKHPHKKFKKWISDCGDPFMGSQNHPWPFILSHFEKLWERQTDAIAIPVETGKAGYSDYAQHKICIIPQSIDFESVKIEEYKKNKVPTFLYCGAIYLGRRDPTQFLDYLSQLQQDFRFIVYSEHKIFTLYKEKLGEKLEIRPRIERLELIRVQSTMDFLINVKNATEMQSPSKLIDYALSGRPILDISRDFSSTEKNNLHNFLQGDYSSRHIVENIEQYNNSSVSQKFIDIYEEL